MSDAPKKFSTAASAPPKLGEEGLVVEGLVTTLNANGDVHVSPMGPIADATFRRLLLRPFAESHTCQNLLRTRQGVFHVTDDVELLARAAIGRLDPAPRWQQASAVNGAILVDACRWFAFVVEAVDQTDKRVAIDCRVVELAEVRPLLGFNRAKHAVVEAAILATRVHLLDRDHMLNELKRLAPLVDKTGSAAEHRAFRIVSDHIERQAKPPAEAAP